MQTWRRWGAWRSRVRRLAHAADVLFKRINQLSVFCHASVGPRLVYNTALLYIVCGERHKTIECPSVRLSVCPVDRQRRAAGLPPIGYRSTSAADWTRAAGVESKHGTRSHCVTQRLGDPGIQRPGDPADPVTLFYNELQMSTYMYRVAQNKIPHRRICNISTISGLILKILEAA